MMRWPLPAWSAMPKICLSYTSLRRGLYKVIMFCFSLRRNYAFLEFIMDKNIATYTCLKIGGLCTSCIDGGIVLFTRVIFIPVGPESLESCRLAGVRGRALPCGLLELGSSVVGTTIAFMIYEPQSLGLSFLICHIRASERWISVALPGSGILWVCESPSVSAIACLASSVCHKD